MIWPNFVVGRRENLALRPVPLSLVKISVLPSRVTCWQLYSRLRSPQFILRQKNPSFQSHSPVTLSPNAVPVICPSSKTCNCTRKRGISRVFEPTAATKFDLFITISCAAVNVGMRLARMVSVNRCIVQDISKSFSSYAVVLGLDHFGVLSNQAGLKWAGRVCRVIR